MSVGAVNKQTGDRIPTAGMPAIDDALDLTSVNPVQNDIITAALANKQDKTDNSLQTTDKTVVGAVNELKSGLTNLDVALSVPEGTGKNLFNSTLNSYSNNGVTITKNDDGTYRLSGTATSTVWGEIIGSVKLKAGTYKLVGWNPNTPGGLNDTMIYIDSKTSINDYGQGGTVFTLEEETTYNVRFVIINGVTIDTVIKPMITEDINATYSDFAPYIPSVDARLEAVESVAPTTIISVTADGVKTYAEILESMRPYSTLNCTLTVDNDVYQQMGVKKFANISITSNSGNTRITTIQMASNANKAFQTEIKSDGTSTVTEITQTVPTSGMVFSLIKYF